MSDTSVLNLITDGLVTYLTTGMIDAVSDATKVGLFRSGKLQADPTVAKLNILIHEGGEDWPDILPPPEYPITAPLYELGNPSASFLRRFVAEYELFFLGEVDRNNARLKANVIFSRFRKLIVSLPLTGMSDSFGETALMVQFTRHVAREGGGTGTFIWRAEHYFEVLTETSA